MTELRILLVDDHSLFRKGVAALLANRPDLTVVGEAADGHEAMERARALKPDLILMDLSMPGCDGLEATRRIKEELPQVHILMLTVSDDNQDLFAAIKNGADGYLLKSLEPHELYTMLAQVQRGEAAMPGKLAAKILQEFRQMKRNPAMPRVPQVGLTPREIETLELVVQGMSNGEIAQALYIAENTVKLHLRSILEKLHLQNRVQAAVYAVRQGLVKDPPAG